MKSKLILGLVLLIVLSPLQVFAAKVDLSVYNKMNLEETLKSENITADLSNYKETENQISIYMFRGQGCAHCQDFLKYVANTLVGKYGNMFKLVSFETWNDTNNSKLLQNVSSFLGEQAKGVPYIVIGDKYFIGYGQTLNTEIESAITTLYNSKKRYDVFEEMNKEEKKATNGNTTTIVLWNVAITSIGVIIVLMHNSYTKKEILKELNKKPLKK